MAMCERLLAYVVFAILIQHVPVAAATPHEYSVGVAQIDITPESPIRLNGFLSRTTESTGVRQRIWAKALAIGAVDTFPIVIITVDTLGIPDDLAERVSTRLQTTHSLPRERLAITASHTHSAPIIRNCANLICRHAIPGDQWQRIERYTLHLEEQLVTVATTALQNQVPSKLSWGIGTVDFAINRRTPGGPVDHDLPVLAVHGNDGRLRAVFTNYATHCVNMSDGLINGDWAGYAMEHIQRQNPGCVAMMAIGCGADSNPVDGVVGDRAEVPDRHGLEIAQEVQRLLDAGLIPLHHAPDAKIERVGLPLAPLPNREHWKQLAERNDPIGYHAKVQLERLDRGEKLLESISYPVQSFTFGDELGMVFLPGEVVVDYALRLKQEFDRSRMWINGYSNSCPGYVPSERILREGGYEGGGAMIYYDIPMPYAPGLEEKIVTTVHRQLPESLLAKTPPAKTLGSLPKSPHQSLLTLHTKPGFRVELVAAEPLIESPVAVNFGPDGRLWVAEMLDYPSGIHNQYEPGGRIRCLYDDDHNGTYDRSEIFLRDIPFPTGVTVWRDGLLICAAPDILFAKDQDGDGKADQVEKLYSGFATHNYQARVNSLEYGLDGWIYGSCGLFGGTILSHRTNQAVEIGGRDFRIKPDTGEIQPVTGTSQQGRVRNSWGDWFGCNNGSLLMHYPLDDDYLRRNPLTTLPPTALGIAAGPDPGRLFSRSNQVLFKLSGPPNRPTAACGIGIYRDQLLGNEYEENSFTCEPVNNLVHRQILTPSGNSFSGQRADDEADCEFLSSTDPWFRPVQARTGPDGGLWVVDMYRFVIEHPIWIPPDTLATLDPRAGANMGRIYRVVPAQVATNEAASKDMSDANLTLLPTAELAAELDTPNGTRRDLVHQLLAWRNDVEAIPVLEQLTIHSRHPAVRIQALCAWNDLREPTDEALLRALHDPHGSVRRQAVRIAEPRLKNSESLTHSVSKLAFDKDPQVRLQVAYSLGATRGDVATQALIHLLLNSSQDPYQLAAVQSSFNSDNIEPIYSALEQSRNSGIPHSLLLEITAQYAAMVDEHTALNRLHALLVALEESSSTEKLEQLTSFLRGWSQRQDLSPAKDGEIKKTWNKLFTLASAIATDESSDLKLRIAAVELLGQGSTIGAFHASELVDLITPQTDLELQTAAVAALGQDPTPETADLLITKWATIAPAVRKPLIAMLLSRHAWTRSLLNGVEHQTVNPAEFELTQRQSLLQHSDPEVRSHAERCFTPVPKGDSSEIIERYRLGASEALNAQAGREIFQKHCSVCHVVNNVGHAVGPDIQSYSSKPIEALLVALLTPNQAIDPRYQNYIAALTDGRTFAGLVAEETSSSITLLAAEGKQQSILRRDLEVLQSTGKSLMPEGFEQVLSPSDVGHLWAFLQTSRKPPKSLPGNQPATIAIPGKQGIQLLATQAEIYGDTIAFELPFQNIGFWQHEEDHVRWRVTSAAESRFDVWCEWACAPDAAGNGFQLEGATPVLTGTVESTGGWDRYQFIRIGTITISAGTSEIVLRPSDTVHVALADLRSIHLVPPGSTPSSNLPLTAE